MRDDQIGTFIKTDSQSAEYISANRFGSQKEYQEETFISQVSQQPDFISQGEFLTTFDAELFGFCRRSDKREISYPIEKSGNFSQETKAVIPQLLVFYHYHDFIEEKINRTLQFRQNR